jgi:hypothetical protein
MAKYTAELRELVKSGVNIFNFNYDFYDTSKKADFEQKFIDHFYFREIGQETAPRFIHYLKCKCHEVLPYYNELLRTTLLQYEILNNYDITETLTKSNSNTRQLNESKNQNDKSTTTASTTGTNDRTLDNTGNANNTIDTTSDKKSDTALTNVKNTTLDSTTTRGENIDVTKDESLIDNGKLDNTSSLVIDGRKVESDTPNGLLSMVDIKGNIYASKAGIEDTTNTTTQMQTTSNDKTASTTETTEHTTDDIIKGSSKDDISGTTAETIKEINSTKSQNIIVNNEKSHENKTEILQNNGSKDSNSIGSQNETNSGNENYTLKRIGNSGVSYPADMIEKHIELQGKIRTVYTQFFDDCEDLFMGIY